ncbi:MAG: hypothetical protein K9G62_08710 [Alphaproteobacteria bacterium]|nr:hypothetical protein [Alphaproteobacteria bacterium]
MKFIQFCAVAVLVLLGLAFVAFAVMDPPVNQREVEKTVSYEDIPKQAP